MQYNLDEWNSLTYNRSTEPNANHIYSRKHTVE